MFHISFSLVGWFNPQGASCTYVFTDTQNVKSNPGNIFVLILHPWHAWKICTLFHSLVLLKPDFMRNLITNAYIYLLACTFEDQSSNCPSSYTIYCTSAFLFVENQKFNSSQQNTKLLLKVSVPHGIRKFVRRIITNGGKCHVCFSFNWIWFLLHSFL